MKISTALLLFSSLFLFGCSPSDPTLEERVELITIETESGYLLADNLSTLEIRVETNLDSRETAQLKVEYYANGELIDANFQTDVAGRYTVWAEVNSVKSNELILEARRADVDYEVIEFEVIFHLVDFPTKQWQVDSAMRLLNSTFRMISTNEDPNGVDTFLQFRLATNDPNGSVLEEAGIVRHSTNYRNTLRFEDWMWGIYWDPDYYINIWVGNTGSKNSFATRPKMPCSDEVIGLACSDQDSVDYLHGIVMTNSAMKVIGSNIISHEMGHFFGLAHVFSYSCEEPETDDYCDDTANYDRLYYESRRFGVFRESCEGVKYQSWNIMDYYYQTSRISISYDQRKRIRTILENAKWSGLKGTQKSSGRQLGIKQNMKRPVDSESTVLPVEY